MQAEVYFPLLPSESEPKFVKEWQSAEHALGRFAIVPQVRLEDLINHAPFREAASSSFYCILTTLAKINQVFKLFFCVEGLVSGMTLGRRLDVDDIAAFLPPIAPKETRKGSLSIPQLLLSAQRDTFTTLGLAQSNPFTTMRDKSIEAQEAASLPYRTFRFAIR